MEEREMINKETIRKLNEMRISEFVSAIEIINSNPESTYLNFDEKMDQIVDIVYQEKYNQAVKSLKRAARLRFKEADIRDVQYTKERMITHDMMLSLSTCEYINLNQNIVLHGPCGSGKSWIACVLGNEAVKKKLSTYYIRMPEMIEKYHEMRDMGKSMSSIVKKFNKYELLIIDEWLMYPLTDRDKQFFMELMEVRYDIHSTIFCSQYDVDSWYEKLGESTLTEAMLDRIVHNMINISMGISNFRKEKAEKDKTKVRS